MNEDGPSVPKTPPSTKPAPVLGPWFDATKTLVERAAALKGLPLARGRVGVFQTLVYELNRHEADTTTTVADLFEAAFEDRSGAIFWHARLSLMTDKGEFIAMLLPHLTAENRNHSLNQLLLDDLVSKDLPASGLLREGRFNPRPVVEWIGEREGYDDLLPASLHAFLHANDGRQTVEKFEARPVPADPEIQRPPSSKSKRRRGRPSDMGRIVAEWIARRQRGEAYAVQITEAKALHDWYAKTFPHQAKPAISTIQNALTKQKKRFRSP